MSFSFSSFVGSRATKSAIANAPRPSPGEGKRKWGQSKDKKKSAGWVSGFGRSPAKRSTTAGPVRLAATRAARSARSAAGGARNAVSNLLNRLRGR